MLFSRTRTYCWCRRLHFQKLGVFPEEIFLAKLSISTGTGTNQLIINMNIFIRTWLVKRIADTLSVICLTDPLSDLPCRRSESLTI